MALPLVSDTRSTPRSRPSSAPTGGAEAHGEVREVARLGDCEREAMLALMQRHFREVTRETFERDLDEKESVVLLYDESGVLAGFSTLLRMTTRVDGREAVAFFSGDTVVDASARGLAALPRLWSRHVFALARQSPEVETYWFLISSGYKTYRFLPTFFQRFVPAPCAGDPREAALLAAFAHQRFGDQYDAITGVVCLDSPTPLREGVAEITPHRLADPHVAFFAQQNPGHARGDELACLTRIHPDNLTPAGRRMVGPHLASPLP